MSVRPAKATSVAAAFRRAMLLAMLGAVASFSVADESPAYFVLAALGIGFAWALSVRPDRPAPRLMINTILLLVVVVAGVEMLRVGVGVSAFAVFVALLLVVKLLDLRTVRDDGQVLVLTVSILIAAVLTSNSFMTGVLMLAVSVLILRAVVLYQLRAVGGLADGCDTRLASRARVDMRSMLLATGFLCALIGGAVFVVLPRNVGSQAFGQWGAAGRSVSGFADQVELGRPGLISMSSKPVMDVTISDRNGRNIGERRMPPAYLRGAVLEEYDGGNWSRSSIMRVPLTERIRRYPANASLKPRGLEDNSDWDRQLSITLRGSDNGPTYLFTPWRTVEFRVGDEPMRMGLDFGRGLFLKDGMGGPVEYTVRSVNSAFRAIKIGEGAVRSPVTPTLVRPRIAELAREVVKAGGIEPDPASRAIRDDSAAVRLLETHLRTRYQYTLDARPVPSGQDATEWFLFDRRAGHCEYYASALALMSRSVGIPARVITGYIASDFNPVTEQYVVRESNAHAWVEAEVAPGSWRTFDGTPPSDFHSIHVPEPSVWRSIAKMYETVEFFWARTVVGYDSNARGEILGAGPSAFGLAHLGDRLLDRLAAGRAQLVTRAAIVSALVFAGTMFLGILALRYQAIFIAIVRWWGELIDRIRGPLKRRNGVTAVGDELEGRVLRCLERLGAPKPGWLPLKAHLRSQHDRLREPVGASSALGHAADVLYEHRFAPGGRGVDPRRARELMAALARSEKEASATAWGVENARSDGGSQAAR